MDFEIPRIGTGETPQIPDGIHEQWLEARAAHRQQLFGYVAKSSLDAETVSSLAALALAVDTRGSNRYELMDKQQITEGVVVILAYHDKLARGGIFSLVNPEKNLERISFIT